MAGIATEEHVYSRHGGRELRLRLYRPAGQGPFPAVLDLHGGAWCVGTLEECRARDEYLAAAGLAAVGVDFRQGADGYPASSQDINLAIRWVKAHAARLGLDAGRIGLCGQSSGGHLAMLAAMRPDDARYAALPLGDDAPAVDASVRCVVMAWPVINPLSRYRHAQRGLAEATPPSWIGDIPERHDLYWKTEAAMAEGNPMLALERGEAVRTPPALWVQGRPDAAHDYRDPESPIAANEPERFVADYRRAGGQIELVIIPQENRYSANSFAPIATFLQRQLGAGGNG